MAFTYKYGIIDLQYILMRNKNMSEGYNINDYVEQCNNTPLDQSIPDPIPIDKKNLLKTTIQSIMKLKRDYDFQYPILLFDASPYHKVKAIENYKADRYIPTDEEIAELEKSKECKTPEEVRQIEIEQKVIELKQLNFSVMQEIKYGFLSDDWNSYGFHAVLKKGYEADDLAYLLALEISRKYQGLDTIQEVYENSRVVDETGSVIEAGNLYKWMIYQKDHPDFLESGYKFKTVVPNKGDKSSTAVLLTADKDWLNFQLPGVEFYSTYNGSNYPDYLEYYREWNDNVNKYETETYKPTHKPYMNRYEFGILCELSGDSHNNAVIWTHGNEVDWCEFVSKILLKDKSLPDYDKINYAFECMNMMYAKTQFMKDDDGNITNLNDDQKVPCIDDSSGIIWRALDESSYTYTPGAMQEYCTKNFVYLNFSTYDQYINGFSIQN